MKQRDFGTDEYIITDTLFVIPPDCKRLAIPRINNEWIPVSERLPDTYTPVLVSDSKYVWIDSLEDDFDSNGNYVVWWDSSNSVDFDKTAWMELPKPYEEEVKK